LPPVWRTPGDRIGDGPATEARWCRRIYAGAVLDLTTLDLDEIATALADQTDYEHCWLINQQTGEIVFWTRDTGIDGHHPIDLDDLDPDLLGIDPLPSHVWYRDMADFADQISDDHVARRLIRAIQGRGAFRRFKDELHEEYPELLPVWYAFRDNRAKRRAVGWLLDHGLIDQDSADSFLDSHPDPTLP
jgi:hypothetical protein